MRPSERVRLYFEKTLLNRPPGFNQRIPTARELSLELKVGVSTVQKVSRELAAEGRLQALPGRGTFVTKPATASQPIAICLGGSGDAATKLWQHRIGGAIMQTAAALRPAAQILPLEPAQVQGEQGRIEFIELVRSCRGLILFPSRSIQDLVQLAVGERIPSVTLHPIHPETTSDFVSPCYASICHRLGTAWIACGRRRLALVQAEPAGPTAASFYRAAGLLSAIGSRLGVDVHLHIVNASGATRPHGREAAATLFSAGGFQPDAVFCMGDYLAHGLLSWLRDNRISCPDRVSVVSGTGLLQSPDQFSRMTAIQQPLDLIGQRLLHFSLERIDAGHPIPGEFVPCDFIGGATTSDTENALLIDSDHLRG